MRLLLFAIASFLSALLLFLSQPLFAKLALPMLGGAPAVWNTCMVFYQAVLLLGYGYSHWLTTRCPFGTQVRVHGGLLIGSALFLPFSMRWPSGISPENHPVIWLLVVLSSSIGLPFFLLSATSPLVQKWFSMSGQKGAGAPQFLFSVSNFGSLLALLSYPVAVERFLPVSLQRLGWSVGYLCFGAVIAMCGRTVTRCSLTESPVPVGEPEVPPSSLDRTRWVIQAFIPSSLLLGVTTYLTTDISPIPLLWVLPLAIYLATFVMVFSKKCFFRGSLFAQIMPLAVLLVMYLILTDDLWAAWLTVPSHLAGLFVIAMVFHGALARTCPSPRFLTDFYFWISVGGVLGGVFNALIGPVLFNDVFEYPFVLILASFLIPREGFVDGRSTTLWKDVGYPLALGAGALSVLWGIQGGGLVPTGLTVRHLFIVPVAACALFYRRPRRFGGGVVVLLLLSQFLGEHRGVTLCKARSFFGTMRVTVDLNGRYHGLSHGRTIHGGQSLDPRRSREPLTYYHPSGPAGHIFRIFNGRHPSGRVAVVGLGAGTLVSYGRKEQSWVFYEIDPLVRRLAEDTRYFSYLRQARSPYRVVLGDARLTLSKTEEKYDLIVVDAFGSDAVPVHLLTREAMELYFRRLAADGVLAFHVSNRYLELERVLGGLAQDRGVLAGFQQDLDLPPEKIAGGLLPSTWVVFAKNKDFLHELGRRFGWRRLSGRVNPIVWTDDRSDVLSVFRWRN
ncbi:MAG TPA: fused MFS/spermidine synthase [Elusimicrobiota bacterium]|nr:fused MFS/spermidine synthase [Elusimicrobiota bacterium]